MVAEEGCGDHRSRVRTSSTFVVTAFVTGAAQMKALCRIGGLVICQLFIKVNQSHYRPEVPRGFREVKVPRLRVNGPGWW